MDREIIVIFRICRNVVCTVKCVVVKEHFAKACLIYASSSR